MARRTKDEAQATRSHILDTAERVFDRHGVSGTSLHEIAKAAGLTRGAIYWHFDDKADLFNAMMERATMPLEEIGRLRSAGGTAATMRELRDGFVNVLKRVVADVQMTRVFGIATHKVEYSGEMAAVRERHLRVRNECLADLERTLKAAVRRGELPSRRALPARAAAVGLHALLDGLLQNWMLDPGGFDLVRVGSRALDAYLGGLTAEPPPHRPT